MKDVYEDSLGTGRPVTYSRSLTFVLTHDCPWHCRYCGFRTDQEGLLSDQALDSLLEDAAGQGAREALLISGERPDRLPHIRKELALRGFSDFWEFTAQVADRCAQDNRTLAPEKRAAGRIAGIQAAGRARIPFTSGILVGWGESQRGRLESLEKLAELHAVHGHLQEILIQRYVPNEGSRWPMGPAPTVEEYRELFERWRAWAPGVAVQIPPNLEPRWTELLSELDDLGGISWARDEVNPTRPWGTLEHYAAHCRSAGRELVERLPVYDSHLGPEWLTESWLRRAEEFRWGAMA